MKAVANKLLFLEYCRRGAPLDVAFSENSLALIHFPVERWGISGETVVTVVNPLGEWGRSLLLL
jgi:hypothetical protein